MGNQRTFLVVSLACLGIGCTSLEAPREDTESWKTTWKNRAGMVASGTAAGARAVGASLSVAARGVVEGFDDPDAGAYGAYPHDYPSVIQTHLMRFEGTPRTASLRFGRPVKGYINKGLFQGGGIEWQGYLVDVTVEIPSRFEGQEKEIGYTVRMRDGEVIEVHDARYAQALRRLETATDPRAVATAQ